MGYVGFRLGLMSELAKLVALIFGFFVSFKFYQGWGDALADRTFLTSEWAGALVMALAVAALYWAGTRLLRILERLVQVTFQEKVNQWVGLAAGLYRGALVVSVMLVVLQQLPSEYLRASVWERSLTGPVAARMAPGVYDFLSALPKRLVVQAIQANR